MLPVWASRLQAVGERLPTKAAPYTDGVTTATPQSDFDLEVDLGILPDSFKIFMEINRSADTNSVFTEELTDWIGQPSVVYSITLTELADDTVYAFQPIGRGGLPTENLKFHPNLNGLDSALELLSSITLQKGKPSAR
jgi:hypothetical protein